MERGIKEDYKWRTRAQWYDCDRENVLFFGNFFRYVTAAEEEYIRSINLSHDIIKEKYNIGFFRIEAKCTYINPILYGDMIEVHLKCDIEKKCFLNYHYEFYRKDEQKILAKGKIKVAACTYSEDKIKITEIPEELMEKLNNK